MRQITRLIPIPLLCGSHKCMVPKLWQVQNTNEFMVPLLLNFCQFLKLMTFCSSDISVIGYFEHLVLSSFLFLKPSITGLLVSFVVFHFLVDIHFLLNVL